MVADLAESAIKRKMEIDPEFRKRWIEKSRKAALGMKNRHKFTREEQSRGGKKSIGRNMRQYYLREKEILKGLQTDNNRIFPKHIIDGFEFENEILNIIEIKINSGRLSKPQKEFEKLLQKIKQINFKVIHEKLEIIR